MGYYLEPKILFYFLRRAYDPVLVSFERTADRIAVWVVNDSAEPVSGLLEVSPWRFDGQTHGRLETQIVIEPGDSRRCIVTTDLGPVSLRTEFLEARFAGRHATCLLIGERYLHLPRATLRARMSGEMIAISTDVFAGSVRLQVDGVTGAVFEDNHFDMPPGQQRTIRIMNTAGGRRVTVQALNAEPIHLKIE